MKEILIIIILGIVEGITEFFPISSNGHLILINYIFNIDKENIQNIIKIIQIGPIFSIILLFKEKIKKSITFFYFNINNIKKKLILILFNLVLSCIPISILGFMFYKKLEEFYSPKYISYFLILGSIFFILSEFISLKKIKIDNFKKISFLKYFIIGSSQCFSLLPGVSRLGITISIGLILNIDRYVLFKFSMILFSSIMPAVLILEVYKNFFYLKENIFFVIIGVMSSFLTSLIFGRTAIKIMKNTSLIIFAIYRIFIACIILFTCN
ncbi:bacA [Wigglesworthia glossinidia endosymbiont of Glossina brevipalpis]|uniref:Undecaprenyl-diphosphatase n=1 Tax=Wigglesworthia glossinidia brevipalpis TaxID=36870 RepID=UPPP_WIGBR|nr:RecName: Full=Undecaprenyl-diphosphatase; AltName: Full=Bacitracin resistance protein; AltName: Full=Undecaprenyl pyrophosphate phosphatase [Wigglesworthia glossinidia endosymbiont of Glossina brevipalpis]BAC24619.1 bacA [Wigglesworthia glossinidia endosymbiont of Glossina brevipalpis]